MPPKSPITNRLSEKRQFLVHIEAEVIRRIKILALDRNVTASSLVQEALVSYLASTSGARQSAVMPGETP